jgi:hypothetical protein
VRRKCADPSKETGLGAELYYAGGAASSSEAAPRSDRTHPLPTLVVIASKPRRGPRLL